MNSIKINLKKSSLIYNTFLFLKKIYRILNIFSNYNYNREVKIRKYTSFFEFQKLSEDLKLSTSEIFEENSFYGNNLAIKNAIKRSPYKKLIEHGYYFGNYVPKYSFSVKSCTLITFSDRRVEHLSKYFAANHHKQKKTKIVTIGPYINYAEGILKENKKEDLKKEYGKILLVFPSHSIEGVNYKYKIEEFIKEIEKVAINYDSVFICMYWKDIQNGTYKNYQKNGYLIVTAGHRNDRNFLGRLKDLIDVSSFTMSNSIGTHIGYCVTRNKLHYLFQQKIRVVEEKVAIEFERNRNEDFLRSQYEEYREIIQYFSNICTLDFKVQNKIVEKYWGKTDIRVYEIENH